MQARFPRLGLVARASGMLTLLALAGCATSGNSDYAALSDASQNVRLFAAPGTVRSDEVTLLWNKPEAIAPDATYEVYCDGARIGSTMKTHYTVKRLAPGRRHAFTVGVQKIISNTIQVTTAAKEQIISVLDYGAKGDGTTLNTTAIQAAINACPPNGIVLIPRGTFLSGALFLKSDMTLEIAVGGVLKGSTSPADYEPFIRNRFEGWELDTYASLLNAGTLDRSGEISVRNLSIRGEGKISGGGTPLGRTMIAAHGMRSRGRLICLMNCSNVEIQGLAIEDAPCWTIHYIYSENVTCHGLTIQSTARNGDGMDPDSSKNVFIFNCSFSTGDDCIAIKSGKNPEGNAVNRPTENVFIFDCRFTRGHGISIGSEMSGGVRNVLVQDCIAGSLLHGMQIKGTKDRGGFVENVTVRDCELLKISILTNLNYNNDGEPAAKQPHFRNFRFLNLDLSKAQPDTEVIILNGFSDPGHETRDVLFRNIKLPAGAIVKVDEAADVTFSNVRTADDLPPNYEVTRSENVAN